MSENQPVRHPSGDPDSLKGSLEDQADDKVLRLQVPFRGFPGGLTAQDIAGTGVLDSLPGEVGEHGEHSGEELKKPG